jgi:riboflavin kinase/FMN adenylyltransferase
MKVFYIGSFDDKNLFKPPSCVALGNFDGLHTGHQKVIGHAINIAKNYGLQSGVMTFDPHPKEVLQRSQPFHYLTPLTDKLRILEKLGVDFVFVVRFDTFLANLTPEQFIQQYIEAHHIKHLVVGFDFYFGRRGSGSVETLSRWSRDNDSYTLHVMPSFNIKKSKVSSTRIREMLKVGDVEEASTLLGYHYQINGFVLDNEAGKKEAAPPVVPVQLHSDYSLPQTGIYLVSVRWNTQVSDGILYCGMNACFD